MSYFVIELIKQHSMHTYIPNVRLTVREPFGGKFVYVRLSLFNYVSLDYKQTNI